MESEINNTSWLKIFQLLNESQKRFFAGQKSLELGHGGIKKVSELTGISEKTIQRGRKEIQDDNHTLEDYLNRIRKTGGGRKTQRDEQKLIDAIKEIVDQNTLGDPMNALRWTCKSTRNIVDELRKKGIKTSQRSVCRVLHDLEYSLQGNKKILSGEDHPDRDAQFKMINRTVKKFTKNGQPVISADTKKKEAIGNFENKGKTWAPKQTGRKVLDHDFQSLSSGMAVPYGVYDIKNNEGFVNVGQSADTAEFAVNSILRWWRYFGKKKYSTANSILICADGGGSNGSKNRAWKIFLQKMSNETGLSISICHYPPATSKWNKIEHKMFSFISLNWKGVPLENYETIIKLIKGTKTRTGLKVKAKLDKRSYEKGLIIPENFLDSLEIEFHKKYPLWNYTISPNQ
jgi:transposase